MRSDCGHSDAAYFVLTCGDSEIDESGCGEQFRACWHCAESGAASKQADTWGRWHRPRCRVGYDRDYRECRRCGERYEEGGDWELCPHGTDEW